MHVRSTRWRARRAAVAASPWAVLSREFFAQFFTSEVATSDFQLRQAIVGVLAFLVTPGFILMISVFPMFQSVVIRSRTLHAPQMIDAMLAILASALIAYSMASVGLVAVMVWDSLSFDRRDAMVLGPLPIGGSSVVGAKLAALAALMLGAAVSINVMSALPFASGTAESLRCRRVRAASWRDSGCDHRRRDVRLRRPRDGPRRSGAARWRQDRESIRPGAAVRVRLRVARCGRSCRRPRQRQRRAVRPAAAAVAAQCLVPGALRTRARILAARSRLAVWPCPDRSDVRDCRRRPGVGARLPASDGAGTGAGVEGRASRRCADRALRRPAACRVSRSARLPPRSSCY